METTALSALLQELLRAVSSISACYFAFVVETLLVLNFEESFFFFPLFGFLIFFSDSTPTAPQAISGLSVISSTNTSIVVAWQEPAVPNGVISKVQTFVSFFATIRVIPNTYKRNLMCVNTHIPATCTVFGPNQQLFGRVIFAGRCGICSPGNVLFADPQLLVLVLRNSVHGSGRRPRKRWHSGAHQREQYVEILCVFDML